MASNKELKSEASELGADLGIDLDFKGMKNEDLVALVSDLKAKIRDRDTVTQADGATEDTEATPAAPAAEEPPAAPAYRIATGKALTTMRGILSDGDPITARDVIGGQATIARCVESGHITEV